MTDEKTTDPPAWIHDGRQVWYLPHQANDTKYAGTVRGEATLVGGTTWVVRLTGMDNEYEKLHPGRRTVAAAACDSLRPRAVGEDQEMFEKFIHELIALALMTGRDIGVHHGGQPTGLNYRIAWEEWVKRSAIDPVKNYWVNEAYKLTLAGTGLWKKKA